MKTNGRLITALTVLFLLKAFQVKGEEDWMTRSSLNVQNPGIVESILPPELFEGIGNNMVDLCLIGPDGRPRSFELYWREPVGRAQIELTPVELAFAGESELVWEGESDHILHADTIYIDTADKGFVAKVDVDAMGPDGWVSLKKDAALFDTGGQARTALEIERNIYQRVRLTFKSFDKKYEKKFTPIRRVLLAGERPGKDYFEKTILPDFQQSEQEGVSEISLILPGQGLWIKTMDFATQAQFQGTLNAGIERIEEGEQHFKSLLASTINHVSKEKQTVSVNLQRFWPHRNFVLQLAPSEGFVGRVTGVSVTVRCPRLTFFADTAGEYTAMSGTSKTERIKAFPGDSKRVVDYTAAFSAAEINTGRKPESLAEKYQITGGPFNDQGYSWLSRITLPDSGYYRLVLNAAASLDDHLNSIRIVRENTHVPFFFGKKKLQALDLIKSTTSEYNPDRNISTMTIRLPLPSSSWSRLTLYAKGIFQRTVRVETPKPGNMGWENRMIRTWESRYPKETRFDVNLNVISGDLERLRIIVDHGDNEAIKIDRITATYAAPTLNFIAQEKGDYLIYGGNPKATPPVYDLSLVQSRLLEELPKTVEMDEVNEFRSQGIPRTIARVFSDRGWGLYAMLGLVTLVLLILIVRLFPKAKSK